VTSNKGVILIIDSNTAEERSDFNASASEHLNATCWYVGMQHAVPTIRAVVLRKTDMQWQFPNIVFPSLLFTLPKLTT
ncbi:hypothetical protein WUBG_17033, partial [Wuchereria bancrofti]